MIIPRVSQRDWLPVLRDAEPWNPGSAPMLVVAPHPDDETLSIGGIIAAQTANGVDVTVVAVTDGEHAYQQNRGLAALRREEQTCALARLGVPQHKIIRFGLTDSCVADRRDELMARLQPLITADSQVVAPWCGDFHPDHEACARAAAAAAQRVGAALISYFFWTWHRGTVESLAGVTLRKFELSDAMMTAKREALACHASQLQHNPEPEILPDSLLWPARLPFEVIAL
jgi:LmbE family N-acetylglucosaminyl deacetylase